MANSFEKFFKSGKIGKNNIKDVFMKKIPSTLPKITIKPITIKPLKLPKMDLATKKFFEQDVKNFITKDLKEGVTMIGDGIKGSLKLPKLMTDLMTNVASGLNTPLLLPGLLIVGAIVAIQVIKVKST